MGQRSGMPPDAAAGVIVVVVGGGGGIPRAPGGPVDLDRYALRVGSRADQVERNVRAGVGEQPRALAENNGDELDADLRADPVGEAAEVDLLAVDRSAVAVEAVRVRREVARVEWSLLRERS